MKAILITLALCLTAFAQSPKKTVAVYMAGKEPTAIKGAHKVLGTELAKVLTKSGEYTAVDRTEAGRKIVSAEHIFQRSGAVDPNQVKKLGKQLGVAIVCIAEITEVMKSHYLEARFVDVETAEILNIEAEPGNMAGATDIVRTAQKVAQKLVLGEAKIYNYSFREIILNPDKAIEDYTDAIQQEPSVAEYYYKRGFAYFVKEDYDRVLSDFSEAVRLNPNYDELYLIRGTVYYERGDYDSAISDFTKAMRLNPEFGPVIYFSRGEAYSKKGDYDMAISDHTEAIRLNPNYAEAYSGRGNAYVFRKDYGRAILDYTEAIRLNQNYAEAYLGMGIAHAEKGELDKAISHYTKAIKLNPNLTEAYIVRAKAYYDKNDNGKAMSDIAKAKEAKAMQLKEKVTVKSGSFTDPRDKKKYLTVKISSQTWMAENLNYNASGSKCYGNNSAHCNKYGRLYNWQTAKSACPSGWHLPSKSEYEALDKAVGGENVAGTMLKAKSGWNENGNGMDNYSFSALPGGGYSDGSFISVGTNGYWWSASENNSSYAYYRGMSYLNGYAHWNHLDKNSLFSVRCLQD